MSQDRVAADGGNGGRQGRGRESEIERPLVEMGRRA